MTQKILMCAPDFFGVDYVINPWMATGLGQTDRALAQKQWSNLKDALGKEAELAFIAPQPGLPDLVFTANAGFVLDKTVVVSHFHSKERQGEEPFNRKWFEENNFTIADWPYDAKFEGAGDALLDRGQKIIWAGYGFRSIQDAPPLLEKIYKRKTLALHLVDPRFYHLDTCFCPLEGGYVMYFPKAFDVPTQKLIEDTVPADKRIVVGEKDALDFACNAVDFNKKVFLNKASEELQNDLRRAGFTAVIVSLSEFLKSGGAAKCLTLKLNEI